MDLEITSIQTQKVEKGNKLVGTARVVINNCFAIGDIRIIQGGSDKGLFVAFPSRKKLDGTFKDICHPINKETRKLFEDVILADFKAKGDKDDTNTSTN